MTKNKLGDLKAKPIILKNLKSNKKCSEKIL